MGACPRRLNFSLWQGATDPPNAGFGGGFNLSATDRRIGNNRSVAYGATYCAANTAMFARPETTPRSLLLSFHHLPFDYRLEDGRTLAHSIRAAYDEGAARAAAYVGEWQRLASLVDAPRHAAVAERLAVGARDAATFRDTAREFFSRFF